VHDDWMSRRPSFDLENLANRLGIVRVRTEAVHGFRGERDELAGTQRFDGMQNLLLQNPCSDHPSIIAGAPNPRGARVRHVWRAANTEGPGVRYPLAASEATHLRARLLRGAGTIPFPAFVSTSELVHRPILIVELERHDFHRAVPGQRSQAQGAAVLESGDVADERIEIGRRRSADLRDPSASPQLIARGGRAVREVGNEDALRSYTALGRERAMRSLQHRAGPYDDAVERRALQCDRGHFDRLLRPVAQDDGTHARLLNRALDLAEAIHDLPVDCEDEVSRTQDAVSRRSAHEAGDAQDLAPFRAVLRDSLDPVL